MTTNQNQSINQQGISTLKLVDGMITTDEVCKKRAALCESLIGKKYIDSVWGPVTCEVIEDTAYGDFYRLHIGRAWKHKKVAELQREEWYGQRRPGELRYYKNFCSKTDCSTSGINELLERYSQQVAL